MKYSQCLTSSYVSDVAATPPQPAGQTPTSQVRVLFTSKMSNATVCEMESSCVHGGLDSSQAPVHSCTIMPADLSEGQPPVWLHQDSDSGAVKGRLWAVPLSPRVCCGKHWQRLLHESFSHGCTTMETSMSNRFWSKAAGRERGVIILRSENVNNSASLGADWVANAFN